MNIDDFFTTGQQHLRQGGGSEDYALSALAPDSNSGYAAVADGCGGAFARTDIGSRAMCLAFAEVMHGRDAGEESFDEAFLARLKEAFSARFLFSPSSNDYLATLVALAANREKASVFTFGDGAHLVHYSNGLYRLQWLEWRSNAPLYLNHLCRPGHYDRWAREFHTSEPENAAQECWTVFKETETGEVELLEEGSRSRSLDELLAGYRVSYEPRKDGIDCIAIFTDGLFRVNDVEPYLAAHEFVAYKNFVGGFVKRRMLSALEKYARAGSKPRDDLAVATVWFGQ